VRLLRDVVPDPAHRERFASPTPRLAEGLWLAAHGASAAVDVSDGLVADLAHIAAASGVRIEIDLERLPLAPGVDARLAAVSGEEFELAVTGPVGLDAHAFERELGVALTAIGRVCEVDARGSGVTCLAHGTFVDLAGGYDHLSI
jgi:thiamine-monophosphate kinase